VAVLDFFQSRNNSASITPANYVGHIGRLWFNSETGEIRKGDGTPGGVPIALAIATSSTAGTIKAGPGINISSDGTLTIDSSGLSFNFGDFVADVQPVDGEDVAILKSFNANEDIVLESTGTGKIAVIGSFGVYATNGGVAGALAAEPIFRVLADGQVRMLVPGADEVAGAFEITANETGAFVPPTQTGVVVHTTGNSAITNRTYLDANDNYPIIVGRRYNGTVDSPTPVLNGDVIFRLAGQAATGSSPVFQTFGPAKINWLATEDQGPNNQGGKITVDVTANGTSAFGNAITAVEFTSDGVIANNGFDASGSSSVNLGAVGNVNITGGNDGDVLKTDGAGNLAWVPRSAGELLTPDAYIIGDSYNGEVARTWSVDATTTATANKVVARDANANIAAATTSFATRQAGSFGAGQTLTIDMATDKYVHANITGETVTVAYTNITAGKEIYIFFTNAAGVDLEVNSGIANTRATNAKGIENVKNGGTSQIRVTSFGTTVADCYVHFKK